MIEEEYFTTRLDNQINWYDKKSVYCQKVYKRSKSAQIILSALIPFAAGYVKEIPWFTIVISVIGVLITCIEGILSLGKYHENWIEYRGICETLKREKYMYLGRAGIYSENSNFEVLVERIETIISKENIN